MNQENGSGNLYTMGQSFLFAESHGQAVNVLRQPGGSIYGLFHSAKKSYTEIHPTDGRYELSRLYIKKYSCQVFPSKEALHSRFYQAHHTEYTILTCPSESGDNSWKKNRRNNGSTQRQQVFPFLKNGCLFFLVSLPWVADYWADNYLEDK